MNNDTTSILKQEQNGAIRLVSSSINIKDRSVLPLSSGISTVSNLHNQVGGASFSIRVGKRYITKFSKSKLYPLALVVITRAYEKTTQNNKSYSINSLHELTGIHARTIEKYIKKLEEINLVVYGNDGKFRFKSIQSDHQERNITINVNLNDKPLKNAQKSLLRERFLNRLKQIDFYKNAISRYYDFVNNPNSKITLKEHKKNLRWLRSHCNFDFTKSKWKNLGWSLKSISSYIGTSIQTAFSIVSDAVKSGVIVKENNYSYKKLTSDYDEHYSDYTYIHNGYMVIVGANSYSISSSLSIESTVGGDPHTPLSF